MPTVSMTVNGKPTSGEAEGRTLLDRYAAMFLTARPGRLVIVPIVTADRLALDPLAQRLVHRARVAHLEREAPHGLLTLSHFAKRVIMELRHDLAAQEALKHLWIARAFERRFNLLEEGFPSVLE